MLELPALYTETIENNPAFRITINIFQDEYAENPFDFFPTLGTLEMFPSPQQLEEFVERLSKRNAAFLIGSTCYDCFVVYVEREKFLHEFNRKRVSNKLCETIISILNSEYEEYKKWLNGEVYGFTIEREGEELEACFGFYSTMDCCLELAREAAQKYI